MKKEKLKIVPIKFKEANEFIAKYHRHHKSRQGWKFGMAVSNGPKIVGVAMVGGPNARTLDNGWTLEVLRTCTDGTKNANSMLYGACWRATQALGYKRLITYTLKNETGKSILAANWKIVGEAGGGTWNRKSRPRLDKHDIGKKTLFEILTPQ